MLSFTDQYAMKKHVYILRTDVQFNLKRPQTQKEFQEKNFMYNVISNTLLSLEIIHPDDYILVFKLPFRLFFRVINFAANLARRLVLCLTQ